MARILVVDWDQYEVRALVAHLHGTNVQPEQYLSSPMFDSSGRRVGVRPLRDSQTSETPDDSQSADSSDHADHKPTDGKRTDTDRTDIAGRTSGTRISERENRSENSESSADMDEPFDDPDDSPRDQRLDPGYTLRRLLENVRPIPSTVLVGIGRHSVEAFPLTIPPTKETEIPGLVQVQAMRESSALTEDAVLDYAILSGDPSGDREAMGVVLPAKNLQQIHAVCEKAGLKPARILIRLFGTASLYRWMNHFQVGGKSARAAAKAAADKKAAKVRKTAKSKLAANSEATTGDELQDSRTATVLVVSRNGDEADLLVMSGSEIRLTRTVRLPTAVRPEIVAERLAGEIHRTFVVAETVRIWIVSSRWCSRGKIRSYSEGDA